MTGGVPGWVRFWAALTVAATLVLLALGGIVTTFKVGMADTVWPTYPWHLALIDYSEPKPGFIVEHTHRLAGYVVGCLVIVLAVGLARQKSEPRLAWLGYGGLAAVIAQGLLGGFRVRLNELVGTDLAAIHGVFAQVVFSLMVATAVLASNKSRQPALDEADVRRLRTPLKVLVGLVLLQVIWGAILRHADRTFAARLHLLTAFAVVGFAVWVLKLVRESDPARRYLKGAVRLLEVLLLVQLFLGVEAWFGKFRYGFDPELQPALTFGQAIIRTAHQLLGACLLATATALAVLVGAQARRAVQPLTSEASPNTQRPEQEGFLATSANRM